jgi:hypothetical protein
MDRTNAERQRRYIAKLKKAAKAGVSNADHAALAQELAAAKARIAELEEVEKAMLLGARAHVHERREAKPKVEKPPLPPDEERDRIIKGLRTRVRNLTAELQETVSWASQRLGIMSRETRIAIDKVLHPDNKPSEADKDRACKGWNAWKNDYDKARRRRS